MTLAAALSVAATASANQSLRIQVNQRGDFVLFGNTLGYECEPSAMTPAPIVGAIGACGSQLADSAPDILWRSDSPLDGQAEASTAISPAQARSTAVLQIPAGASISHAFLYWGAKGSMPSDDTVTLDRPGAGGFAATPITAAAGDVYTDVQNRYHAVADVTALVQANGPGAYRLSDLDIVSLANLNDSAAVAGWWMVVFYQLATDLPRNLTLFDGFDLVSNGAPQDVPISGFQVPMAIFDAKLGVATYEGDNTITGDRLLFKGVPLSNNLNPANNFFNSTRTFIGAPLSVNGDLPQLTGEPQSLSGIDLDVVDVTLSLQPGDTSASIQLTSTGDTYHLAMLVTSISTIELDLSSSTMSVVDVNGGAVEPGDELEYAVVVTNTGDETAIFTTMSDSLPMELSYVPGSLEIVAGPNAGALTDNPGDDQGEYDLVNHRITVQLGAGASAFSGGELQVTETTSLRFRATVKPGVIGPVDNQAIINAAGASGSPFTDTPTDGNGASPGSPPTEVFVQMPAIDTDGDGLSDVDEASYGTLPDDRDSDDDGLSDGDESNPGGDPDGDDVVNAKDADSDGDGLFDGMELGMNCSSQGTDQSAGKCVPDADNGATTTDPLNPDTDGGGTSDGIEDSNGNGAVDICETDPTVGHGADDLAPPPCDMDGGFPEDAGTPEDAGLPEDAGDPSDAGNGASSCAVTSDCPTEGPLGSVSCAAPSDDAAAGGGALLLGAAWLAAASARTRARRGRRSRHAKDRA